MEPGPRPIAALATPWGESALAVIRASGEGTLDLLAPVFRGGDLRRSRSHTLHHGTLHDQGDAIDEVVLGVFRAPRSYTGEDVVEIYCHGGPAVVRRLLALLQTAGFGPAQPGEFTLRAFLNGKIDLTRAEAIDEIIRARTDRARGLAMARLAGGIQREIDEARAALIDAKAALEAEIEYPDDEPAGGRRTGGDLAGIQSRLERLLATYSTGRLVQEGASVAIAGRPNAGKSTLFNLLLREERAIVSDTPGTTRDYLEATVDVGGIPLRLLDTAGLRDPRDELETEGVLRTARIMESAALVLYVVDASAGLLESDSDALAGLGDRALPVWNKVDLAAAPAPAGFTALSARRGDGLPRLEEAVRERLHDGAASGEAILRSDRQRAGLEAALEAIRRFAAARAPGLPLDMAAAELEEALRSLAEVTGEVTSDEVLRRMFSRFCLGK